MEPTPQQSSPAVPIAIICGFAMIAIAVFFTNNQTKNTVATNDAQPASVTSNDPRPVSKDDYILGNPNAPILMVEYSDYDCPFCKQYHSTLNQIMDEYGITGQVAWVYRQFPLTQLHPNAPVISKAALCVGKIGKNDAFWKFSQIIFDSRDIDEATNITKLPNFAEEAGVSRTDYLACMDDSSIDEEVKRQISDGYNSGARGTPFTVLIVGNQQAVISGAQPYEVVKGIVQNLVDQLEGTFDPATETVETTVPNNEYGAPILQ